KGFKVTVYDAFEKGLERCKSLHQNYAELFMNERGASKDEIDATFNRLKYTTDLAEAVKDADIISESIPEVPEIKINFYKELSKVAPEKTIFTTNSSTTLPSDYVEYTGRPKRFCALHFANGIWDSNIGEVMGHPGTSPETFDGVVEFAREIGMVPIPIKKEQNGYILNTLLVPFLNSAIELLMNGVTDPASIDKTWMISTRTQMGPCIIMDMVGMKTIYDINSLWAEKLNDPQGLKRAEFIKENYIDKGKMGALRGEGFYKYPNPEFKDPDFLK
ncbi:MAG: 3-hydroxyacyl-CoA dehydrogenase, partial [Bacteroidota bacterium]